jgi:hypothetical protein
MTDRDATELKLQLDAMRAARAEDARTCARLTARVKDLEVQVGDLERWKDAAEMMTNAVALHGIEEIQRRIKSWEP